MFKNKKRKVLFLLCLFLFFGSTGFVLALEINYPRVPGASPPQEFLQSAPPEEHLSLYVLYIFNLVIWIAGIIALGVLIYAGILYLTAAGSTEKIISAREQISQAFLGTIILLSSYIIFQILNPQLTILKLPELKQLPEPAKRPEAPEIESLTSSIDVELPLGRIIEERIFQTYVEPGTTTKPRLERIKENATTTFQIADKLKEQSEDLKEKTYSCNCPVLDCNCCSVGCCSCDPCRQVRDEIEDIQDKNLEEINKLRDEQEKTIEETKQLKFELAKLERLKKMMEKCPLSYLESLASFFSKMVLFEEEDWILRKIKAWQEISIIYYDKEAKKKIPDYATFYCPVGGTFREKLVATKKAPPLELPPGETPEKKLSLACKTEVPVGEIIDRAKRTAKLLIQRLERLNDLQGEMIRAVDGLHVLVSQCSSWRCVPVCYMKICIRCVGIPCPITQIESQVERIEELREEIEKVVSKEEEEEIGIIPIIDKIVPKILEDLNKEIKKPMSLCISETYKGELGFLGDCQITIGGISPYKLCVNNEVIEEFEVCLEKCYLKEGHQKYKECLQKCLEEKSKETNQEAIKWFNHFLNFYCCHPYYE